MKHKYSTDNDNQLIVKSPRKANPVKPRGRFGTDKNNHLFYQVNEPSTWRKQHSLPPKIVFKGRWRLNQNHDLMLILDKNKDQFQGDILTIRGNIISCDTDILAFEVKSYDRDGLLHIQVLKLNVTLFADKSNRICFTAKRLQPDVLTLAGNWEVNENQQIIYQYERTGLKTKTKVTNTLIFRGFWQISSADRLTYILKHSSDSRFDFRAQIETPTIYPQKGVIKYRLGLGLREDKTKARIITLYGTWKFSRNLGLVFEIDYGKEGLKSIEFSADVTFQKNIVTFSLKDKEGEPLSLALTFTHRFLKRLDAEAFLRLKAQGKETGVEAGFKIPF